MSKSSVDTPLMRQYLEIKQQQPEALLFFRMGDFFELFFDDAVVAAQALELTLTSRDRNKEDPVPMCGVPHHAVTGYIHRLLEQGHRVAICDQVEDPRQAKGLVKRAVTQVITPGVVLDTDHLEAKANNYLAVIATGEGRFGLAALDLSTFELRTTEVQGVSELQDELARLGPKEVVCDSPDLLARLRQTLAVPAQLLGPALRGDAEQDTALIAKQAAGARARQALAALPLALRATAAALRYAGSTQPVAGIPSCRLVAYQARDYLQLDEATVANLELFSSLMERQLRGSLIWVLDKTLTAMGGRMLRQVLAMPLLDVAAIRRRQDAVELLVEQLGMRGELREALRQVYDLERLTSRTVLRVVTPRELMRLCRSLEQLPRISELLRGARTRTLSDDLPDLLHPPPDRLEDVASDIRRALVDAPPAVTREGGMIRRGYRAELDELLDLGDGGKSHILAIEARERAQTGISSLKVRYNRVFGYFIEVTRSNLSNVPPEYQRKQTLANAERFVTPELAEYEAKVLGAEERQVALEQELFEDLRQRVAAQAERLGSVARWVAMLDVLAALAEVAQIYDYVRPQVDQDDRLEIEEGRHPVVERFMSAGQFVPNDLVLDPEEGRMLILTGPNMAGKSTVMRQAALITLMAQAGSFVPAKRACLGVVDRIFTRVGASDNLARGESTFMVEMRETASILASATARSLVVLDEIGRGTATYDGISIAWAVAEHLHDRVGAKCLFATHYHELCALADVRPHVRNYNIAVQEYKDRVIFLRKLVPGGSSRAYGIEVARLAGLDGAVVARAREILASLEGQESLSSGPRRGRPSPQLPLFAGDGGHEPALAAGARTVLQELAELDPNLLTPLQALMLLATFKERLQS